MKRRSNAPRRRVDRRAVLFWVLAPLAFVLGTAGLMLIVTVAQVPAAVAALVGLGWGCVAGLFGLAVWGTAVAR